MVNHGTKNETEKITVIPYLASMINYATMVMKQRTLLTINLAHVHARGWSRWRRREQYHDRNNRETEELRLEAKSTRETAVNTP